ncbi:hypothetical protein [Bradyrhizobium jicamae]|uniref:hypothetical protein n=1 Tax=Bradyrhizobium jicamae TaxID=280332 RepID=UPI001BA4AC88|nr:hypothetical protein [Bradyrhizobium jicamae]MBR0939445.1 hypothetical protein [Bradyrhizobium jicamae]
MKTPILYDDRPGFKYHLKVYSFRAITAVAAWALIVAAFYEKPELLTAAQRAYSVISKRLATSFHRLGDLESSLFSGRSAA